MSDDLSWADGFYDAQLTGDGALARKLARELLGEEQEEVVVLTNADRRHLIYDELRQRVRNDQDAVVLGWGPPGSGKSTFALDLCAGVDETFTPRTLPKRVAFREWQVPDLYDATPRFGACWVDEAASAGLLSTATFQRSQQLLVELINIIRYKNVVLIILIPDPADLAKSFRARRADFRFQCDPRDGNSVNARWGRRVRGSRYYLDDGKWLGFDDDKEVGDVSWPDYRTSSDRFQRALWDAYHPLKLRYGNRRVSEIRAEMLAEVSKKMKRREKEMADARE